MRMSPNRLRLYWHGKKEEEKEKGRQVEVEEGTVLAVKFPVGFPGLEEEGEEEEEEGRLVEV